MSEFPKTIPIDYVKNLFEQINGSIYTINEKEGKVIYAFLLILKIKVKIFQWLSLIILLNIIRK